MKSYVWALLFLTSHALAGAPLEQALESIRQRTTVPALGAAMILNGEMVQSAMVGVRKWGDPTPAQVGDEFHLGSCTKAMTATLFALFVEQGKVNWDSKLSDLFPEVTRIDPAFQGVTVEMLLAHRGGLTGDLVHFGDGSLYKKLTDPSLTPSEGRQLVASTLLSAPPTAPPGAQFLYSNAGYITVGRILEKLSGMPWEQLITERLFEPMKMGSCGFGPPGDPQASSPDQPWPHTSNDAGPVPIAPGPDADNPPTYGPAGSVHCSMADWGKFLMLHIDGFNHKPTPLLTPASFDKLHATYPGQPYTYGGWIRDTRAWAGGTVLTHEGSNTLNVADVWLAPLQSRALIGVTNIGNANAEKAVDAAITQLIGP